MEKIEKIELSTILNMIKNKNPYGLELLYQNYFKLIFGTIFSVLKNEEDSKDVLQNVFVKLCVLEKEKFPNQGHSSWLYTLTKNEAIMFLRKNKKGVELDKIAEIPVLDKGIEEFENMDEYNYLIKSLNEKQKEVITLKILGGFSHKEIGEILNKPIGTIQWMYNTSIKQLKIALASMSTFVFIVGILMGNRVKKLLEPDTISVDPGIQGFPMKGDPISMYETIITDPLVVTGLIILAIGMMVIILFFIYSEKLPTKTKNKCI